MGADSNLQQYTAGKDRPALRRILALFDEGSFVELDSLAAGGVLTGYGTVNGNPVFAFSQDTQHNSGAVGRLQGAKLRKLYDLALKAGGPVVGIYDSMGADLRESGEALAAYGEMLAAANNLSGVVPQLSLVLGVCAGTAAMMACSADLVVMTQEAQLFVTPPFGSGEPEAGTAQAAARSGVAHVVAPSEEEAIGSARLLLDLLPLNNLSDLPAFEYQQPSQPFSTAADAAQLAGALADADSLQLLQQDFGAHTAVGLATVGGRSCGIAAVKGGLLDRDDCAKLARFIGICDSFRVPVVSLLDSCGFAPSAQAEIAGSIRDMARLAHVCAEATTPKVAVVTGEAFGPAYIALAGKGANADLVLAWPQAVISPLAPETAAAFLCADQISGEKTREQVLQEYKATQASALTAAREGTIEGIVEPEDTRTAVLAALEILSGKRVTRLPKKHSNLPL